MNEQLELLTVPEVAQILRCGPQTVRNMCERKDFVNARKVANKWLVPLDDLERYLRGVSERPVPKEG